MLTNIEYISSIFNVARQKRKLKTLISLFDNNIID